MERLTYQNLGDDTISIDLHNGFSVIAIELFDYETKKYNVSLYMKKNEINLLDLMEEYEKVEFDIERKMIKSAILRFVFTTLSQNGFDNYIKRYNYMTRCFDKGNEIFEEDLLSDKKIRL